MREDDCGKNKVQLVLREIIKCMREKHVKGNNAGLLGVNNRHKKSEGGQKKGHREKIKCMREEIKCEGGSEGLRREFKGTKGKKDSKKFRGGIRGAECAKGRIKKT